MTTSTVKSTEYAIDWGDELEEGFASAEEASDFIASCVKSYTEQGWSLEPIEDGRVVTRNVTVTTVASDWTASTQ